MKKLKYSRENYGDILTLTEKEIEALEAYKGIGYKLINSLLSNDGGAYETIQARRLDVPLFSNSDEIKSAIQRIVDMYLAMVKYNSSEFNIGRGARYFRGTSVSEMSTIRSGTNINKMISATTDGDLERGAAVNFALDSKDSAVVAIDVDKDVLTIDMSAIELDSAGEEEVIISPFTRVNSVERVGRRKLKEREFDLYKMSMEPLELTQLSDEEIRRLEEEVEAETPEMANFIRMVTAQARDDESDTDSIQYKRKQIVNIGKENTSYQAEFKKYTEKAFKAEALDKIWSILNYWKRAEDITYYSQGDIRFEIKALNSLGIEITGLNDESREKILEEIGRFANSKEIELGTFLDEMKNTTNEQLRMRILDNTLADLSDNLYQTGDPQALNRRVESLERKINDGREDIEVLEADIARIENEMHQRDEKIKEGLPKLKAWKEKIVAICASKCKKKEIELDEKIAQVDKNIEASKQKTQEQIEHKSEQQNTISGESVQTSQNGVETKVSPQQSANTEYRSFLEETGNRIVKERVQVASNLVSQTDRAADRFNVQGIVINMANHYETLEKAVYRSARFSNEIRNMGFPYYSRVAEYRDLVNATRQSAKAVADRINSENVFNVNTSMLNVFDEFSQEIANGGMSNEIIAIGNLEENLLKKAIFERFCDVATKMERDSLMSEVNVVREKEQKRGISRVFGGPKKQEIERANEIEGFVQRMDNYPNKTFRGQHYSARNILADMDLFRELHEGDQNYVEAIQKVESLRKTLLSYFRIDEASYQRVKETKRTRMGNGDPRAFILKELTEEQEKRGAVYQTIQTPKLETMRVYRRSLEGERRCLDDHEKAQNTIETLK